MARLRWTVSPVVAMTCLITLATAVGCSPPSSGADGPSSSAPSVAPVAAPLAPAPGASATEMVPGPVDSAMQSSIHAVGFVSPALGVDKTYWVYLPRGYEGSATRFPVIYLFHGLGGDESNWLEVGGLREVADKMALSAIVVMPDGDASFYIDGPEPQDGYAQCLASTPPFQSSESPTTYCVKTPSYEKYVMEDLVNEVDLRFRTQPDARARAIAGLSMGGFGALSMGLRHPERFGVVVAHSAPASLRYQGPYPFAKGSARLASTRDSWGVEYPSRIREHMLALFPSMDAIVAHDPVAIALAQLGPAPALYFDCGTEDGFGFADHAQHLHEVLDERGIPHTFELAPGAHDFAFWRARLPYSLAFMMKHLLAPRGG